MVATGLAVAFFVLVLAGTVVPRGAGVGLACGLVGGVAASVAVVRDGERALAVLVALAPLAMAVGFLAAELIGGLV